MQKLIIQWALGLCVGSAIIAVTSPLFVRSYVPRELDSVRGVYVFESERNYRWRSEGYATTLIGEHGMPGRSVIGNRTPEMKTIVIWGDSQAEGVCVGDHDKLHSQLQRKTDELGGVATIYLPMARSGDNGSDWLDQIPRVEPGVGVDLHLLLVCELSDLLALRDRQSDRSTEERVSQSSVSAWLPAFMIQAVRNIVTEHHGGVRRLRFGLGRVQGEGVPNVQEEARPAVDWKPIVDLLASVSNKPVCVVYAPKYPQVSNGTVRLVDPDQGEFKRFELVAEQAGIRTIDLTDALGQSVRNRIWPHGFHNGEIGTGHLNSNGYRVIAHQIAPIVLEEFGF